MALGRAVTTTGLILDQALFGYRDGHRLLAVSRELSRADRGLLGRQTDSPDAGRTKGWDALFAGFPLPSGLYALAMTWPATEMPRAGCVWTHVLLADIVAVAALSHMDVLGSFRRPDGPDFELEPFSRPLTDVPSAPLAGIDSSLSSVLERLVWAFFEPPERPVQVGRVQLGDDLRHELLLRLWLSPWPKLRAKLSFADAPLTTRSVEGEPFDFQLQRSAKRGVSHNARVLEGLPKASAPAWATAVAAQALQPDGLALFMTAYSDELPAARSAVPLTVGIWMAHAEPSDAAAARRTVASLVELLPDPTAGAKLKRAILRPTEAPKGCAAQLPEWSLLEALAGADSVESFRLADLELGDRTRSILQTDSARLRQILEAIASPENAAAREILDALVGELDAGHLGAWVASDPLGLVELVAHRPVIAGRPEVWEASADLVWDAVRTLRGTRQRAAAIQAILAAEANLDPTVVLQAWPKAGGAIVAAADAAQPTGEVMRRWFKAMEPGDLDRAIRAGQKRSPAVVAAGGAVLEKEHLRRWPSELVAQGLDASNDVMYAANVFRTALSAEGTSSWARQAVRSYCQLYAVALREGLGDAQNLLDEIESDMTNSRVEARLARGMNRAFKEAAWEPRELFELTDVAAFQAVVDADAHAGLARRVLPAALASESGAQPWQIQALKAAIVDRADRDNLATVFETAVDQFVELASAPVRAFFKRR